MNINSNYINGDKLLGDDFDYCQIKKWYEEEEEGYSDLISLNSNSYSYSYHCVNKVHGFSYLKNLNNLNVLSFGGAYGDELMPIIARIKSLDIIEPSTKFFNNKIKNVDLRYIKPDVSGKIMLNDGLYDLITCFGVLHHIPNVSYVISEMYRVLKPGGIILLREPIVSMGDWTKPRKGLTKNERGIPLKIFREILTKNSLVVKNEVLCFTKPFDILFKKLFRKDPYNSMLYIYLDKLLGLLLYFNYSYNRSTLLSKISPTCVYYVIKK